MRDDEAQNLIQMFGGIETLIDALCIHDLPEELQIEIIARFSENVFKHILLRVPREYVGRVIDVIDAHTEDGHDFKELVVLLEQHIPNMEDCVNDEISRAIEKYRLTNNVTQ